jgi:hypothetical protein
MDAIQREGVAVHGRPHQLRETGEPGPYGPAEIESRCVPAKPRNVGGRQRPRAHGAHLAAQDVDELRNLVEAGRAQQPADARHAPVAHRAELQHLKRAAPEAHALLAKQHRPPIVGNDRHGNHRHRRREHGQARRCAEHVE